jgi:TRAP-type C4-dicarboxylate transport system permease small subunit
VVVASLTGRCHASFNVLEPTLAAAYDYRALDDIRVVFFAISMTPADPTFDTSPRAQGKWERRFVATNRWVVVALLGITVVLVIANVIARYVFSYSLTWVEEVSRYLMIWSALLGCGLALRVGGHIAVESLADAVPPAAAKCIRILIVAILVVSLFVLTWLGIEYVDFAWEQETPVLSISYGRIYLAVPIGAMLMLIHLALVAKSWITTGAWERVEGFDPQAL